MQNIHFKSISFQDMIFLREINEPYFCYVKMKNTILQDDRDTDNEWRIEAITNIYTLSEWGRKWKLYSYA